MHRATACLAQFACPIFSGVDAALTHCIVLSQSCCYSCHGPPLLKQYSFEIRQCHALRSCDTTLGSTDTQRSHHPKNHGTLNITMSGANSSCRHHQHKFWEHKNIMHRQVHAAFMQRGKNRYKMLPIQPHAAQQQPSA